MNRVLARVLMALLVVLSSACMGGRAVRRTYYSLAVPAEPVLRRYTVPRYPVVVRVERVGVALAYRRQEIAYRTNPYELRYDWYRLWVSRPDKMFTELLAGYLRRSGLFAQVVEQLGERAPDYVLRAEVLALEELDSSEDVWYARLAMRLALVRFADRRAIWEHVFDVKRRVHTRRPVFVVRTLDAILAEQMQQAIDALDARLAALTGAPAPERAPARPAPTDAAAPSDAPDAPPRPKAWLKR